ncbi:hypothetical protein [Anaerobiospirillum thomasii]|uniref:hypothetical protein n=1 Tax=Anaerobiospirillum thomasii TaxID=179995 RepID=UPI001558EC57|nr:hypothetical protein [Anaerobiospirillum thomasii]
MDTYIQTSSGFTSVNDVYALSDGNTIPCLGYGTCGTFDEDIDEDIHVLNAIRT